MCKGHAQATTHARLNAVSCVRNFVCGFFLFIAFARSINPALLLNFDATHFAVRKGDHADDHIVIKNEKDTANPIKYEDNNDLEIGIKLMMLASGAGTIAEQVFMVADGAMTEGDFDVYKIPGLCSSTHVSGFGYLVFCKTRAGNANFFEWFARTVVLPGVAR